MPKRIPSTRKRPFTTKELKFVQLYATSKTPAEAARNAGYTEKNSANAAYKLMQRPEIVKEIERQQAASNEKAELKRERILDGLLDIFDGEKEIIMDGHKIKVKEKAGDRVAAAAQLNKMQGFYAKEEVEHKHSGQISCVLFIPDNGRDKID